MNESLPKAPASAEPVIAHIVAWGEVADWKIEAKAP